MKKILRIDIYYSEAESKESKIKAPHYKTNINRKQSNGHISRRIETWKIVQIRILKTRGRSYQVNINGNNKLIINRKSKN